MTLETSAALQGAPLIAKKHHVALIKKPREKKFQNKVLL